MKNLKVSKNAKVLALAGASIVIMGSAGFGFDNNNIKTNDDSSVLKNYFDLDYTADVDKNEVLTFRKYIKENDLIPYKSSINYVKSLSIGDGYYAKKAVYNEETGETNWELVNPIEMKVFTGILRTSNKVEIKAYEVKYEDDHFVKTLVTDFDKNKVDNYFVDKNDPVELVCPSEDNYYYGKVRSFTH